MLFSFCSSDSCSAFLNLLGLETQRNEYSVSTRYRGSQAAIVGDDVSDTHKLLDLLAVLGVCCLLRSSAKDIFLCSAVASDASIASSPCRPVGQRASRRQVLHSQVPEVRLRCSGVRIVVNRTLRCNRAGKHVVRCHNRCTTVLHAPELVRKFSNPRTRGAHCSREVD